MRAVITTLIALSLALVSSGCVGTKVQPSGFLGDQRVYAAMQPDPEVDGLQVYKTTTYPLAGYDSFIVPPVSIYLNAKGRARGISDEDLQDLAEQFRADIVRELGAYYQMTNQPTAKTALLRIAITDADPNIPLLNIHPGSLTTGTGLGGATAEAELIEAVTGKRIAAFLVSSKGKRYEYTSGLTKWGHTKSVLEDWAKLIGERVRKAHG